MSSVYSKYHLHYWLHCLVIHYSMDSLCNSMFPSGFNLPRIWIKLQQIHELIVCWNIGYIFWWHDLSNFTILAKFYGRVNLTRIMVLLCPHQTDFLLTYPFIMLWWWANTSTLLSSSPPVYNERNSTTGATCNDLPKIWHVKELKKLINPDHI